jgi:hypothetical protein
MKKMNIQKTYIQNEKNTKKKAKKEKQKRKICVCWVKERKTNKQTNKQKQLTLLIRLVAAIVKRV